MSATYTKLSHTLLDSTVWVGTSAPLKLTWIVLLAKTNAQGQVMGSIPGIAKLAEISVEEAEAALAHLMAPDKYSRTKEHEGRRIKEIDGGWQVLNHLKYRDSRDSEKRREQNREAKRRSREKGDVSTCQPLSSTKVADVDSSAHTDTDTDTDTDLVEGSLRSPSTKKISDSLRSSSPPAPKKSGRRDVTYSDDFEVFWKAYPRKVAKEEAAKAFAKLNPDADFLQLLLDAVEAQKGSVWRNSEMKHIPHGATWLNTRRWEDELTPAMPSGSTDTVSAQGRANIEAALEIARRRREAQSGPTKLVIDHD